MYSVDEDTISPGISYSVFIVRDVRGFWLQHRERLPFSVPLSLKKMKTMKTMKTEYEITDEILSALSSLSSALDSSPGPSRLAIGNREAVLRAPGARPLGARGARPLGICGLAPEGFAPSAPLRLALARPQGRNGLQALRPRRLAPRASTLPKRVPFLGPQEGEEPRPCPPVPRGLPSSCAQGPLERRC